MDDSQYQASGLANSFGADGGSPLNGDRSDAPQTQEQLLAIESSLKTRVAELEVINDFMQRRLAQYEQYGHTPQDGQDPNQQSSDSQLRTQLEALTQSDSVLRVELDESHRRENMLKRRLDELEAELKEVKDRLDAQDGGRPAKKPRLEEAAPQLEVQPETQPEPQIDPDIEPALRALEAETAKAETPAATDP